MVDERTAVERRLEVELDRLANEGCPPRLAAALRLAVLPTSSRARPTLCMAVSSGVAGGLVEGAVDCAVAVELIHCASLVHDDMPCFDDAELRRGQPTVHRAFGEALALLAGDGLIVLAFDVLTWASTPAATGPLVAELAKAAGAARGLIAGQAWESEPTVDVIAYHRAKTGALFGAAAALGARLAGADPGPWRAFGTSVGCAYQVLDDLADASGNASAMGKPVGRDALLARPSAVESGDLRAARAKADQLLADAYASVPPCRDAVPIHRWLQWMSGTWSARLSSRRPSPATGEIVGGAPTGGGRSLSES